VVGRKWGGNLIPKGKKGGVTKLKKWLDWNLYQKNTFHRGVARGNSTSHVCDLGNKTIEGWCKINRNGGPCIEDWTLESENIFKNGKLLHWCA